MGFQDRDYERYEPQYRDNAPYRDGGGGGGFMLSGGGGGRMMVTNIVIVCVAIFVIDAFTQRTVAINTTDRETGQPKVVQIQQGRLSDLLSLKADLFTHPWQAWQLLTYGFAHASLGSQSSVWHVLFNMFTLWMLGRMVEMKYGRKEFLTFYLASIVFSGLAWVIFRYMFGQTNASCVGASGAVSAVVMLFIVNFPREKLLIWGVFPMPAWLLGVLLIGYDMLRAISANDGVAHDAHLAGVAFAALYWKLGWHFSSKLPEKNPFAFLTSPRGPKLKVHDPETPDKRDKKADEVLAKLHREGEGSLTRKERKILAEYSERMKQKRG